MKRFSAIRMLLVSLLVLPGCWLAGQNSSGWRGINRDGVATGFDVPAKWPAQLTKGWQVQVGRSDGSPVMLKNRIYLHTMQDGMEVAMCVSAKDGKEIWKTSLNKSPDITGPAIGHPGPRSTPCVADGKLFTLGAGGVVTCLDIKSGKVLWKNDTYTEVPQFYTSSSPLVINKLAIFQLGGKAHGTVVAFDINDGKEVWKLEGIPTTYSSPAPMKADRNMVLVQSETDLCGVTLEGKLAWKIPCPAQRMFYNSSSPVADEMNIVLTSQGTGTRMVTLSKQGDTWETKELWANKDLGVSFNTPLLKDGFLYGHDAKTGYIFCINAKTGEKAWADATPQNRFASITDAGKVIVSLPATGNLVFFVPSGNSYQELAKYKVSETETYSSPILDGNHIFIKDKEMLTCWSVE